MAIHGNQTSEIVVNTAFLEHVDKGLSTTPKFLSSRYFYDEIGDQLFVKIMKLPEYYLTRAEHEILKNQTTEIINALQIHKDTYFELVELGAGDGTKTKELLKPLVEEGFNFSYLPIDISGHALKNLKNNLKEEIPGLSVQPKQGDYFGVLDNIKDSKHPKIVLFLGSNLGNLEDDEAHDFLHELGASLNPNDKLFLGLDLVKSKDIVLPAYNDEQGITAKFNLNLLHRINNEFDADFNLKYFEHEPEYKEEDGIAKSYLVSTKNQEVYINALDKKITFKSGEKIHTEISRKYNEEILNSILRDTNFTIQDRLTDSQNYFADYILKRE